jgi:hypothetical protein
VPLPLTFILSIPEQIRVELSQTPHDYEPFRKTLPFCMAVGCPDCDFDSAATSDASF